MAGAQREALHSFVVRGCATNSLSVIDVTTRVLSRYVASVWPEKSESHLVSKGALTSRHWVVAASAAFGILNDQLWPLTARELMVAPAALGPEIARFRRWCPACFDADRNTSHGPYERLVWTLSQVQVCTIHQCLLSTQCSQCRHSHRRAVFSGRTLPGMCSKCFKWLGGQAHKVDESRDEHSRYLMWTARSFDDLLERPLQIFSLNGPVGTLSGLVKFHFDGIQSTLAKALGRTKGCISGWLSGKIRPNWRSLCEISYVFHVPMRDILEGNQDAIAMSVVRPLPLVVAIRTMKRDGRRLDISALKHFLFQVESNVFPEIITLAEVARRVEKSKRHLRELAPEEYRSLSVVIRVRRQEHIKKLAADRLVRLFALLQTMPILKEVGRPVPNKRAVVAFFQAQGYSLRHAEVQLLRAAIADWQKTIPISPSDASGK
jgi:DNA-binding XRE family transcriptional regulator